MLRMMRVEYLDIALLLPLWELPEGGEFRRVLHPLDHLSHKDRLKGEHLQICFAGNRHTVATYLYLSLFIVSPPAVF
jgi:hypothetical protein